MQWEEEGDEKREKPTFFSLFYPSLEILLYLHYLSMSDGKGLIWLLWGDKKRVTRSSKTCLC